MSTDPSSSGVSSPNQRVEKNIRLFIHMLKCFEVSNFCLFAALGIILQAQALSPSEKQ